MVRIELVLVKAALEAEQQPVIAVPRCVDCFLIDQHRVDDATHLDELLPVPAIAGKARHFSCAHRANLAEAYLRHQPIAHGVLQRAALAVVQHLMSGGLAYVEDRLALQVMGPDLVSDHGWPPRSPSPMPVAAHAPASA